MMDKMTRNLSDPQCPEILDQYSEMKFFRDKSVALYMCFMEKKNQIPGHVEIR